MRRGARGAGWSTRRSSLKAAGRQDQGFRRPGGLQRPSNAGYEDAALPGVVRNLSLAPRQPAGVRRALFAILAFYFVFFACDNSSGLERPGLAVLTYARVKRSRRLRPCLIGRNVLSLLRPRRSGGHGRCVAARGSAGRKGVRPRGSSRSRAPFRMLRSLSGWLRCTPPPMRRVGSFASHNQLGMLGLKPTSRCVMPGAEARPWRRFRRGDCCSKRRSSRVGTASELHCTWRACCGFGRRTAMMVLLRPPGPLDCLSAEALGRLSPEERAKLAAIMEKLRS